MAKERKAQTVRLASITRNERTQQREKIDWIYVQELKEVYEVNEDIEPILLFQDDDGVLWLADGNHRVEAAYKAGNDTILAYIESGGVRDAILYSCGANAKHGLKRTNADKLRAVTTLLTDEEWGQWNNSEIARKTGTSTEFVRIHRVNLQPEATRTKVTRNGKEYTQAPRAPKPQAAPEDEALQLLKDTPTADDTKQIEQLAQLPAERQVEVATAIRKGEARNVTEAQRALNRKELGTAPLPEGRFNLIQADPCWSFDNEGFRFAAENKYPTMTLAQIIDLPVADLAADRAVLFLWYPASRKPSEAEEVIEAWGFEYKQEIIWLKNKVGPGFYTMGKHEKLIIATKGTHVTPDWRPESVIKADTSEHSRKPDVFTQIMENMYPDLQARLELFARTTRPGWTAWGNETDKFQEESAA